MMIRARSGGVCGAPARRWLHAVGALLVIVALLVGVRLWPRAPLSAAVLPSRAVVDAQGALLRLTLARDGQYRLWTPLAEIAAPLPQAVQLYEDRGFAWHPGVDPAALVRAAWATFARGERQGGSTLTMQLARRLYRLNTRTVPGKLRQIGAALWLEARYGKREILEAYLNVAPYGGNLEGVGAASLVGFGKAPAELTLAECLALAVIPQDPNGRQLRARAAVDSGTAISATAPAPSPLLTARERLWNTWIAAHPQDAAQGFEVLRGLRLSAGRAARAGALPFRAPHAVDAALAMPTAPRGGRVALNLDGALQATLERLVAATVRQQRDHGVVNAAALLVDARTMAVRALVGSADYGDAAIDGQVNGTAARRSPGSTLKPLIYALALDQGLLHPATILRDVPARFGTYGPENFDGRFVGPIAAQEALIRSRNVPAVTVAAQLTQPSLYGFLRSAGVAQLAPEAHYGMALALGGAEMTMQELTTLYAMLAAGGELRPLRLAADEPQRTGARLLSPAASWITLQMLQATPRPDTGRPAAPAVAWKTGTSWGFRDAWTVGTFDGLVLAVWVGNFDGSSNPAFVGVQAAAPLFFRIVDALRAQGVAAEPATVAATPSAALQPAPPVGVMAAVPPPGVARVDICADSGELPNAWCPRRVATWYLPGKSPIKVSTLHRALWVDTRSGAVACGPGPFVRREVIAFWSADMLAMFRAAGLPRRPPPPVPACVAAITGGDGDAGGALDAPGGLDGAPQIVSPLRGGTVVLRPLHDPPSLSLRADVAGTTADPRDPESGYYWFVDQAFVGHARAGTSLEWRPQRPGRYVVRVVDVQGRSDAREVRVAAVP